MIEVDLKARIVPESANIWVVHAGREKSFYDRFVSTNRIFLDLPQMLLSPDDHIITPRLRQKIERAREWGHFLRQRQLAARRSIQFDDRPPSRALDAYTGSPKSRSINVALSSVHALFFAAGVGDLVIVASGQGQFGYIRFAEISTAFNPSSFELLDEDDYGLQFRDVNWLPSVYKRRDMPESVAHVVENRRAVTKVPKHSLGAEVYSLAYENYVSGNTSKATLFGPRYSSKSALDLVAAIRLTSWLIAAFGALDQNSPEFIGEQTIDDLIAKFYDEKNISDLKLEFTSPGHILLLAKKKALALFVTGSIAMLPLLTSDMKVDDTLKVVNTRASGGNVAPDASGSPALEGLIRSLKPHPKRLSEIKALAHQASSQIGFRGSATAKSNTGRGDERLGEQK